MSKTYKVENDNIFAVGIRFANEANREVSIRPKSFAMLSENDILYIDSVSRLIRNGIVTVNDDDLMNKMGYVEKSPDSIKVDEIEALFKLPVAKLKPELEKIKARHAIDKVVHVAKDQDLASSKLKVIKEVFGVEIFEEIDEDIS